MSLHDDLFTAFREQYERIMDMRNHNGDEKKKEFSMNIIAFVSDYGDAGMTISYNIGEYSNSTKGNDMHATVTEHMRRQGWDERNKPMVLIANGAVEEEQDPQPAPAPDPRTAANSDDDIPF